MQDKYDSLLLKNQLCFPIYLCSKEIVRKYTPFLDELNLTYTQYIVMMYFWEKKNSNVKELSRALLLDPSTLTPLLVKLESKGYIKREKSDVDGRNLNISITKKGMELRNLALSVPDKIRSCIDLSEDEITMLYRIIYKILIKIEGREIK